MITSIILLNCILNDIAWNQALQWGKNKQLVVKCHYVPQQVQTLLLCLINNYYYSFKIFPLACVAGVKRGRGQGGREKGGGMGR